MAGVKTGLRLGALALSIALGACASSHEPSKVAATYKASTLRPYAVGGRRYQPRIDEHYAEKGLASWYSYPKGTRRTATGESFDPQAITAAHRTLPLPCIVEVTNLDNGRKLKVRVNDRGPFVNDRIIDLSRAAADRLGFSGKGLVHVKVRFVGPARLAALQPGASGSEPLILLAAVEGDGGAGAQPAA